MANGSYDDMSQEHFLSIARRLHEDDLESASNLGIRSDYFYAGAQRQHQLETIRHLACYGDLLMLLCAEFGAGKTTLLKQAISLLHDELQVVYVSVTSEHTPVSLVQDIAELSKIIPQPTEDLQSLLSRCKANYQTLYGQHAKRTLLILDDADRAEAGLIESIVSALDLKQADSPVALLLSSASPFDHIIEQYGKSAVHEFELAKLKRSELAEYINQGLQSVGFMRELDLSDPKLDALLVRSHGIPANIETYMASIIFGKEVGASLPEGGHALSSRLPVAAVATIVVVLLGSFIFVADQHDLFSGVLSDGQEDVLEETLARQERLAMLDRALEQTQQFEESSASSAGDLGVSDGVEADADQSVSSSDELTEAAPQESQDATGVDEPVSISQSSSVAVPSAGETSSGSDMNEIEIRKPEMQELPAQDDAIVANQSSGTAQRAPSELLEQTGNAVRVISTTLDATPDDSQGVASISVSKPSLVHPKFRDQAWLSQQQDGAHTLQVLGSYNEDTARNYIERNGIANLYYVKSIYKGRPWYVVLYGSYDDIAQARAAKSELPEVIARENPWIRSFSGIQ